LIQLAANPIGYALRLDDPADELIYGVINAAERRAGTCHNAPVGALGRKPRFPDSPDLQFRHAQAFP
jgi:hypothetical protein